MPFECKKYHNRCGARCCGVVPIPLVIWQKNQHNIKRKILKSDRINFINKHTKERQNCILPITEELLCPFLSEDLSCAIYKDRPEVCRKYGDETDPCLCCPMQKADGTTRSVEEQNSRLD